MAKNTIKAKSKKKGTTKATGRDYSYQKAYNKRPEQVAKRVELNRANRQAGTYGNKDGLDASHSPDGRITRMESQSTNRARKTGFTTGRNATAAARHHRRKQAQRRRARIRLR